MSRDTISFLINNKPINGILTYSVDSDLWLAADAFSFTVFDPDREITAGMKVVMWVNNLKEMVGVIDKVETKITKKGKSISVSGRDLMGILCDHNITEYQTTEDLSKKPLKTIVEKLLKDIPFIDIKDVFYEGAAIRTAVPFEQYNLSPGQTVFDVLKTIAQGRGLYFWCSEDGEFVFGTPVAAGIPAYHFILEKGTTGKTNILEASITTDISEGFSTIIVHSQSNDSVSDVNSIMAQESLHIPDEFPFYKPKVVCINGDNKTPYYEAKRLINLSKAKSLQLSYLMPGHSQRTINYKANVMARVDDVVNNIHGDFLVSGRTLTLTSKNTGPQTLVRLCRPGIVIT